MTIKVQFEGREIEVELPAGYMSAAEVEEGYVPKTTMEATIQSRLKGTVSKSKAAEDPEVVSAVKAKHGLVDKGSKPDASTLDSYKAQFEQEYNTTRLAPVEADRDKYKSRVEKLTSAKKQADIISACAEAGVKKAWLKPQPNGGAPLAVAVFGSMLDLDEERDAFYVRNPSGAGFLPSAKAGAEPWKTFGEHLGSLKSDADFGHMFESEVQSGPNAQPARGANGTKSVSRDDSAAFLANMDGIAKGDVSVS